MNDRALHVFVATVWGEARGEGPSGQAAVAHVILNRTGRPQWPDEIALVCLQAKQFSCWNTGDPNRIKCELVGPDDSLYMSCLHIATGCLLGRIDDPTQGADHYHALDIEPPSWAETMAVTAAIGNQVFYDSRREPVGGAA